VVKHRESREDSGQMSHEALCIYEECRFCKHRVNVHRTPNEQGQCNLELQGVMKVEMCKGKLFFSLDPNRAAKYRIWKLTQLARRTPRENGLSMI